MDDNTTQPIDTSVRIDPNEEITNTKKIILLNQWKEKVEKEIADYNAEREKVMAAYKGQKEKFDRILGVKVKKMKKYDVVMNARKKVLADIIKEIGIATNETDTTRTTPQN